MSNYLHDHIENRGTQRDPIPGTSENNAGGQSFAVDCWERLKRFLVLGAEGGTYYVGERDLVKDNVSCVRECIAEDGPRTVEIITAISVEGRAPKNDPALLALAMCSAAEDVKTRQLAFDALPRVARIGTHLFQFAGFLRKFRGWGRAARTAIGDWYLAKEPDAIAYQIAKYPSRAGYSHRDLLRLSHPDYRDIAEDKRDAMQAIFQWAVNGSFSDDLPDILQAVYFINNAAAKGESDVALETAVNSIALHNVSREMLPTEMLNDRSIWEALLERMPVNAMVRNLGKMSSIGIVDDRYADITERLANSEALRKARVHPLSLLTALKTYSQGHGDRGSLSWSPHGAVVKALDDAFYLAFPNHRGSGKRICVALDVSGSMGAAIAGSPLNCREASAAMALITMASDPQHEVIGFTDGGSNSFAADPGWRRGGVSELNISADMRLTDVVKRISGLPFGGTDCALPMIYAAERQKAFDGFVIYTDSETWAGGVHPSEALKAYRSLTGINAKLVVVGMASNGFSIADPNDAGMLDVVGFDTATPQLIADFIRGDNE